MSNAGLESGPQLKNFLHIGEAVDAGLGVISRTTLETIIPFLLKQAVQKDPDNLT